MTGKVGQALSIGPNQYIDFGDQSANCAGKIALCTGGGGLTVAFWFKLMQTDWVSSLNTNGGMRVFISKSGSSNIRVDLYCVENGSGNKYATTTPVADADDWHLITCSCSTQQIGHTYIDGQETYANPTSSNFGGSTGDVWLGKINSHDRLFYADELVFWFKVLDASRVLVHYNSYNP